MNYLGFVLFILQVLHVLSQVSTNNLYFLLDEGKEKCFLEEIPKDTLVMASYKIEPATQQAIASATTLTVKVKVLDNEAKLVLEREMGAENRVAFTSQTSGEHKLCFSSPSSRWFGKLSLRFFLDIQVGEGATNYEEIARQEHLSVLEITIRRLNDRVKDIRAEQNYQRNREISFRNTSESTNSRVMWWAVIQTVILVGTGLWQITHLKNFFKAKKLV
jgi:hypothetical protein